MVHGENDLNTGTYPIQSKRMYQALVANKKTVKLIMLPFEGHVLDMIFVPFFTTKQQGSGIGLSLAHQIMVQHGGDLAYIDKPNVGACFRLTFN